MITSTECSTRAQMPDEGISFSDIVESIPPLVRLLFTAKSSIPPNINTATTPDTTTISSSKNRGTSSNVSSNIYSGKFRQLHKQFQVLERTLRHIEDLFYDFEKNINNQFTTLHQQSQKLDGLFKEMSPGPNRTSGAFPNEQFENDVKEINQRIMKLKLQIPSAHKSNMADPDGRSTVIAVRGDRVSYLIDELVKLPLAKFQGCSGHEQFEEKFKSLSPRLKDCLLCFAAFPENAIIKKSILIYWWVGEGFIDPKYDS